MFPRDSRFDIFIIDVKGFTLTIPSLKEMAAFRLFKLILFASMNFKLEPNAVNKVEFVAFSVVESNCPNPCYCFLVRPHGSSVKISSILLLNLIFH
jgi:hypothetical protein